MKRDLLDRLPVISRARDYRLYSSSGKRIVDFYQDGGNAVLGHRVPGISLTMKQALDKGVLFYCRTSYDSRLKKAVEIMAGRDVSFSVFPGDDALFASLNRTVPPFFPARTEENKDTEKKTDKLTGKKDVYKNINVFTGTDTISSDNTDTAFWRPLSGDSLDLLLKKYLFVIPAVPFPGSISPRMVLSRSSSLPAGGNVSPVALAPFIRAVYRLINSSNADSYKIWDSEQYNIGRLWKRRGIYLLPSYEEKFHEKVFINMLDKGYLISPDYEIPSILPGDISRGEKDNFIKAVINVSGEVL